MAETETLAEGTTQEELDAKRLAYFKKGALDDIRVTAKALYVKLDQIKRDVDLALSRMVTGSLPYGGEYGPIGTQANSDVMILTAKLQRYIESARIAGASEEDVNKAYNEGIAQVAR